MPRTLLHLGPKLALPLDAVTRALCFTGQRGTGKTSSAAVLVEEAAEAGAPSVVIDPTDVWWGLGTSADGKDPGLGHVIFGGSHGHLPLREDAGAVMARLVVEQRLAAVFSIKHLRKAQQMRFVAEFMEELYHLNSEALLVVIDEAHRFAPRVQMEKGGYAQRCLGAVTDIATLGRANGLGIALVTQRLARLHTDVREACEIMIAKRLVGPNDRKAMEEWLADSGAEVDIARLRAFLPKLSLERALVYAPGLDILGDFEIRMKRTFDSSGTPKVGARKVEPVAASDIDLSAIEAQISETIEQAKQEDPKHLQARIRELEAMLAEHKANPMIESVQVEVPVSFISDVEMGDALMYIGDVLSVAHSLRATAEALELPGAALRASLKGWAKSQEEIGPTPLPAQPQYETADPRAAAVYQQLGVTKLKKQQHAPSPNGSLSKAERAIVTVLYLHGSRDIRALAMLAGYSAKGGGFRNALSSLRTAGIIDRNDPVSLILPGSEVLGGKVDPLPTGRALFDYWLGKCSKAERLILETLAAYDPISLSVEEVAEGAGYEPKGGGFRNALSKLRTLGLINGRGHLELDGTLSQALR